MNPNRSDRGRFACGGLLQQAVAMVAERGRATADDILADCDGKSRDQVIKALQNAVQLKLIERVGVVRGRGAGRMAVYAVKGGLPPRGKYGHIGKVSSIFAMGANA